MRAFVFLSFFLFFACDEYNSNSADRVRYAEDPQQEVDAGDPNFAPAALIVRNRCISCHTSDHDEWVKYTSGDAWLSSGLINRGDPDNSRFIERIFNSGHAGANMPLGSGPLPDREFQSLRKWIAEIP